MADSISTVSQCIFKISYKTVYQNEVKTSGEVK